jgi:hypothetical protein
MTPRIDIDPYKDDITNMARRGESDRAISTALSNNYGVTITGRTIGNRLVEWGIRRPSRSPEAEQIDGLVMQLYKMALRSDEILHVLKEQGKATSSRTLRRVRKRLGIRLRCDDPTERERQIMELQEILQVEDIIGEIEGFGRRLQYVFLRSQGAFFPRNLIFEVYRTINPEAIDRRRYDLQRRRGAYTCPGPNWIWHLDGYMKVRPP